MVVCKSFTLCAWNPVSHSAGKALTLNILGATTALKGPFTFVKVSYQILSCSAACFLYRYFCFVFFFQKIIELDLFGKNNNKHIVKKFEKFNLVFACTQRNRVESVGDLISLMRYIETLENRHTHITMRN